MSTQMQLRGGTTAETLLVTGAQREVTVDTDKNTVVVHDGVTPGGFPVASEAQVADSTYFYLDDTAGGSAANAYILVPQANTNQPNSYMNGIILGFVTTNANTGASTANFQGLGVKNIKYPGGIDPAPGDIFGRVTVVYDSGNDWLELQRRVTAPQPQIRNITAAVSANALTVTLRAPALVDFRASTLGSGTINTRSVTSDVSLTVPANATLGTVNATSARLIVIAIDGPSGVELAITNFSVYKSYDETVLLNTSALSAASTSPTPFYSTIARTGVPFRVLGYIDSTQTVAGTWSSLPSKIQGQGGQNIIAAPQFVSGNLQATTSGTAIDFTGIPSFAKKITISFNSVSMSGTSNPIVQAGISSGVETTGYSGTTSAVQGVSSATISWTSGVLLNTASLAANTYSGAVRLNLIGNNIWAIDTVLSPNTAATIFGAGVKTLAGTLDRVRITATNGTDTFDGGSVNIIYEG